MVSTLKTFGNVHILKREFLSNFIFDKQALVITVGQDGLVANVLKYLDNQLLIGINPDPKRWYGVLLPFQVKDLNKIIVEVLNNKRKCQEITLAKIDLNDGQSLYAVNDLFIGRKTHASARYTISYSGVDERQSSSGIIISTGFGSTGWFKSILAGASGLPLFAWIKK